MDRLSIRKFLLQLPCPFFCFMLGTYRIQGLRPFVQAGLQRGGSPQEQRQWFFCASFSSERI